MNHKRLITSLCLASAAAAAPAAVLLDDNFDANALALNSVPAGWSVTGGTVDIIGNIGSGGFFDLVPGNGAYIDLDGSTSNAGVLSRSFSLLAGTPYTATFTLAGSRRGDTNTVEVDFGSAGSSFVLASADGPSSFSLGFTPAADGSYALSFENLGGDNLGALLLSVRVDGVVAPIPEPATYALMLAGLGLVAWAARRRRAQPGIFSRQ